MPPENPLRPVRRLRALAAAVLAGASLLGASTGQASPLHGPKRYYLALGDSLAFGYQPNGDFSHGYVPDLFRFLQGQGSRTMRDLGCPGETSTTFIVGGCPLSFFGSSQLAQAKAYLRAHRPNVSPVTLDIGANDVLGDIDSTTCAANERRFAHQLARLDANLTKRILPQLRAAMTVGGVVSGDILVMDLYDPLQNACPGSVASTELLNAHLAADVAGSATLVDVFGPFGGAATPNPSLCGYTWICAPPPFGPDIHATTAGYAVIADAFASVYGGP
jgi:lysophospholipase L1-like esterase